MKKTESPVTEVVGRFSGREPFRAAVNDLRGAGFERSDLSVLDSHDSLSAADTADSAWKETLAGLAGEVKYLGPLTAAGIILLSAGPIGAVIAGALTAGLGGLALSELLDEIMAKPHAREFARALEGGAVLLWVRADTPQRQQAARDILARCGAADVHVHLRGAAPKA